MITSNGYPPLHWLLVLATMGLMSCRLGGISESEASHSVNGPLYQSVSTDSLQDSLPAEEVNAARTMLYVSGLDATEAPSYILRAPSLEIAYWTHADGTPRQAIVHSPYERHSWQIYYANDGTVEKIQDLRTGSIYTITEIEAGHLRFATFASDGSFVESYDMAIDGKRVYAGRTPGAPAFSGQIVGTLTGTVQNGSFAVIADAADKLAGLNPMSSEWQPLIDALASLPDSSSNKTLAKRTAYSVNLSRTLKRGGLLLFGAYMTGLIAPAATAYAAAGVAMYCSGLATTDLANSFRKHFDDPDMPSDIRAIGASVIDSFDDPDGIGLIGIIEKAKNSVTRTSQSIANIYQRFGQSQSQGDYDDAKLSVTPDLVTQSEETSLATVSIPTRSVKVHGQAADQSGNIYPLQGTVDASGRLRTSGTSPNANTLTISGSLQQNGMTGTFSSGDGNKGSVKATEQALGTCQAVSKSGGQGAFTYVHTLAGASQVTFSYDAYDIPDQFTVSSTTGGTLFATSGLVSGTGSSKLTPGSDDMVIITITAPNVGTAWDYAIGCE